MKPPAVTQEFVLPSAQAVPSNGPPPLLRTFPSPILPRTQPQTQTQTPRNQFVLEPVVPKQEVREVRQFENNSRFNKSTQQQPKQTLQPVWAPLEKQQTKSVQLSRPPSVKQLDRTKNPEITVLIDIKDDTTFLDAFLQSVVRQTYTKWVGVLGLRNSSKDVKDSIADMLNKLQMEKLVDINVLPEDLTEEESFSESVKLAQTTYVALGRRSDLWVSKKLEKQMAALKEDPSVGLIGTMSRLFGDKVELVNVPPGSISEIDFESGNPIVFSSVVMKRELVDFSKEFKSFDYDAWIRLTRSGVKMSNTADVLTLQRTSSQVERRSEDRDDVRAKYGL